MAKRFLRALDTVMGTVLLLSIGITTGHAQGSRKDDIVFNAQGRPMAGAAVRVCASGATGQPCTPLAQVYSDSALTQALANPLSSDGLGNYNFYAAPGRYMIELSGPGIITKQIPNVILPSDPSSPTFTSVTTTSGISAFSLSLTGNLTVNGSTAVAGSLTVGGQTIPMANQDNQWTAGQRFKGPIPWRDISAYMPAGGCSSSDGGLPNTTTGSINSGSATLTLAAAKDFKNGCGIAVIGAGPTSTLVPPGSGCASISAISRASNVVTVTCSAAHGLFVTGNSEAYAVVIAGVTDTSFNGTFLVATVPDTTHITYAQTAANASSSSGTANTLWGYAHGVTGSTTYNYKFVGVDASMGYSAASGTTTITNGNATLGVFTYNWLNVPPVNNSREVAIYSDKGLGGALTCVGVTFTLGYSDYGLTLPCPTGLPTNPPGAAGPQALNTTIASGGGTSTLVLNASASNTATTQNVYHDESSFLTSCINDINSDQVAIGGNSGSSYGCFVPAGFYGMNGPMVTDTLVTNTHLLKIAVAGTLSFQTMPWFLSHGLWDIEGVGGGGDTGSFSHQQTTKLVFGSKVPAGFVLRKAMTSSKIRGFSFGNLAGHGIWMGTTWDAGGTTAGIELDDLIIGLASTSGGAPIWMDNNTIGVWANHVTLTAAQTGLSAIMVPMTAYGGGDSCCMYFDNITSLYHGIRIDAPAGNETGGQTGSIFIRNWLSEDLVNTEPGFILNDAGPNAPGSASSGINGIYLENVNNADPFGGPSASALLGQIGISGTFPPMTVEGTNSGGFGPYVKCLAASSLCNDPPQGPVFNFGGSRGGSWGGDVAIGNGYNGYTAAEGNTLTVGMPLYSTLPYASYGAATSIPAWAQLLPPPNQFSVTGTGAGGLPAGTYCLRVTGIDAKPTPGETLPTREICQTVGASSSISISFQEGSNSLNLAYSGFRLYYGTGGAGSEANYLSLASAAGPYTYTFTSTAGNVAGTPATNATANLSWLYWDGGPHSCLYCVATNAGTSLWSLGIGDPSPAAGVKLAVKGGTITNNGATVALVGSTICAYQGPASPVTGNSADQPYYTCTVPANAIAAGKGVRITVGSKHTTGTAAVSYRLSFGGTLTTVTNPSGSANQLDRIVYEVLNNAGVQNAQTIFTTAQDSNAGTNSLKLDTSSVNTANSVVINADFNVANTDQVTPEMFIVEYIQ